MVTKILDKCVLRHNLVYFCLLRHKLKLNSGALSDRDFPRCTARSYLSVLDVSKPFQKLNDNETYFTVMIGKEKLHLHITPQCMVSSCGISHLSAVRFAFCPTISDYMTTGVQVVVAVSFTLECKQ